MSGLLVQSLAVIGGSAVLAILGWLAWRWWSQRRRLANGAADTAWEELRAACEGRPCWLVLGAGSSGKSSMLAESGLAWNLRPAAGAGSGSTHPQVWRHDGGCLIELPGQWCESPAPPTAWTEWLDRLRRGRRRLPIAGVVACVPLSDLLRRGPTYIAATAGILRDRGGELAQALGRNPPLYVVLSKSDHVGGYKDFFAGLAAVERQQVLGTTLAWPLAEQPAATWLKEHSALVAALRDRRPLGLMRARDGEAARKMFQFPGQLDGLAQPVGELLGQLARPGRDGCLLRGVYLASCHRSVPAAPPPTMRGERTDLERSVYLGQSRAAPSTGGTGHFLHALLSRVLPADADLARPTRDRRRLHLRLRFAALRVVPAAAILVCLWLLVGAWRSAVQLADLRTAAAEVLATERLHPGDAPRNLDVLDRLGAATGRLAARDPLGTRPALQAAAAVYARRIGQICADRAVQEIGSTIGQLRAAQQVDTDRLYAAFRAYQMLAGAVLPDAEVLDQELTADRRWFLALEHDGTRLDWPTEVLARRQIERLARDLLPHGLGRLMVDRQLAEATARDLGESLWIRQGWDEILREARGQTAGGGTSATVGVIIPGPQPDGVLTRRAWDDVVSGLVDEKAVALERTLAGLSIRLERGVIARRLGERFRTEHRRVWLAVIAGSSILPADDLVALPARITEATGPASPWPMQVRRALDELDPPSALAALSGAARAPWARPSLDPLLELRRDVEGFLAVTSDGRRVADLDRVQALAARFDEACTAASTRLAEVQPDDLRDALRTGLGGLVRGLWQPIDRCIVGELELGWRGQVVPAWRRDCAGRFPFADQTEEVPLVRFAAFANPHTGALWQGMAPIERLRAQLIAGRPSLTLAHTYLDMAERAAAIRDGFFAGGGEQVVASCHVTLVQREGVTDLALGVGSQTVKLYDRPDARFELTLRQGEPRGAKVAVRIITGEWKTLEFANRDWGWLRLLRAGSPRAASDGGWTLTWPFDGSAAGGTVVWRAQAQLEGRAMGEAVAGDLFTGFAVPEAIVAEQQP